MAKKSKTTKKTTKTSSKTKTTTNKTDIEKVMSTKPSTKSGNTYNEDNITVLEGLEPVRKRPGMYIGDVGQKGLNHLIYEIVDNSVDEHLAGYCKNIRVTIEKDGSCTVEDDGRGIPVGKHKVGYSAARVVLTTLHAGGKFDSESYKTSGGLHGVGSSVVNALSKHLTLWVYRDGNIYQDEYEQGKPITKLKDGLLPVVGKTKQTGTKINFTPDDEIFQKTKFKIDWLKYRLHETAYLNPTLTIYFNDFTDKNNKEIVYHEPEGLLGFLKALNKDKGTLTKEIFIKATKDDTDVEVALQFIDAFEENIFGFCNNIYTQEGGTHIVGFKTKFTQLVNSYARQLQILKDKDENFTGADTRNGMTAIVNVKYRDPIFEGQTKTKLASQDVTRIVSMVVGEQLERYFDRNLDDVKAIISCAEKSAKIRKQEEKAKTNLLVKNKFSFDSNGKLANCISKNPDECEIFIVEGDSAGGSAKTSRNRNTQAILPLRGKILNVEKASMDKVLANAEIKTMINTFGCGFSEGYGNDFDINKLRYDKIILMTDADVDGSHIDTLLLTFLYRFMPELINTGHVYVSMPPLYGVISKESKKKEKIYLYDEKALSDYKKKHKDERFEVKRYKGLGEMNPTELWETTLNPENRVLKRVSIEDAIEASKTTEMLMGQEVSKRKEYIHAHANEAVLDW